MGKGQQKGMSQAQAQFRAQMKDQYSTCKKCNEWWYHTKLCHMNWTCTCNAKIAKPSYIKKLEWTDEWTEWMGLGTQADHESGKNYEHGKGAKGWKGKGSGKAAETFTTALGLMTNSLQSMSIQNSEQLVRQLNGMASQVAAAVTPPPERKPKAVRLAEAATRLQKATNNYEWKRDEHRKAEEKLQKIKAELHHQAALVVDIEAEIETIQAEGRVAPPQGVLAQLLSTDVAELAEGDLREVDEALGIDDEDLDEEGWKQIKQAKEEVVAQLKANAATFAGHLKTHLETAKAKAIEQRTEISQASKKRKQGDGDAAVVKEEEKKDEVVDVKQEASTNDGDEILKAARAARAEAAAASA